jgi:ATP-binding cassette subfamily B protein
MDQYISQRSPGSRLRSLVRLALAATAATLVFRTVAAGASLLLPTASAGAIDRLLTSGDPGPALAALMGLLVLRLLAEACGGLADTAVTVRVATRLRYRLLAQVFRLGVPGLRRHAAGDLVMRVTGNASHGAGGVTALVDTAVGIATAVGGLAALFVLDWRLGAVFLMGILPAALLLRLLVHDVTALYGDYLDRLGALAARLTDALAGRRTIRACGTSAREIERVLAPLPGLARSGMRTWEAQRRTSWRVGLVLAGAQAVVLGAAGVGVAQGRLSAGDFLASAMYAGIALGVLSQFDYARANAGRVLDVLSEQPPLCSGRAKVLPAGPGALSFRRVSVRLADRLVLDAVDLDVPARAAVAVVGKSGAGKTTLAQLVGRLLDPDDGAVLIDGVRVDSLDPAILRREVAYAFDRPVLLGATIREALTYGRPDATGAKVGHAVRIAAADDFVRRLPGGLDTLLADAHFSGGELQRLGLARAVVHGGRVLVLDDATSSLDTITEAKIAGALTTGLEGRTRLVVAHRAVTAARADLAAWLENGRIRAIAPHRTLWATEPEYRAIFAPGHLDTST